MLLEQATVHLQDFEDYSDARPSLITVNVHDPGTCNREARTPSHQTLLRRWKLRITSHSLCIWCWRRPKHSPRQKSCLAFEVIIQTFIYSTLSQRFCLISQELLESTNKHDGSRWQVSRNMKQDLRVYHSAPENHDCKDQPKVSWSGFSGQHPAT